MARLRKKGGKRKLTPIPAIEGAYALPLTLNQIEEMRRLGQVADSGEDDLPSIIPIIKWLGENVLRNEKGEKFDDLIDDAEIGEHDFDFIMDLQVAVRDFFEAKATALRGTT